MREIKTVRFWQRINGGYVRLSLTDGQSIEHTYGGPNEEGYSFTQQVWERCGDTICLTVDTSAADCDGQHASGQDLECCIERLGAWEGPDPAYPLPYWEDAGSWQRDYTAEAAGY